MKKFESFISESLNTQQHAAVTQDCGAVLVIAGAGSGKTRVITARIAYLILKTGAHPDSIVALTFTNKAAGEMKHRLIEFLGTDAALPFVGTFHSFCLRLLRKNPSIAPFGNFSILDSDDQTTMVKKILKRGGFDKKFSPHQIISQISKTKNKQIMGINDLHIQHPTMKELYTTYESEKATARSLDFDDLLIETLKLFKKNAEFKKAFSQKIEHLLVDEYQDTSAVQHELLKAIALDGADNNMLTSICAVGDEDQSIYSWRGAVVANMLKFSDDFAPVTQIKIEQNYRSVQPILKAANSVIAHNTTRNEKRLWSDKTADKRILILSARSEYQEADAIASLLKLIEKKHPLGQCAILYRTHFQSRAIEEALMVANIPYKIVGGIQFYERKEIKDMLAYLRLVANPHDRIALFRVINVPGRSLGEKFEQLLLAHWQDSPFMDFSSLVEQLISNNAEGITPRRKNALENFLSIFDGTSLRMKTSDLLEKILEKTYYLNYLRETFDAQQADTKIENIRELVTSVDYFEKQKEKAGETSTVETFLHEIALMQEKIEKQESSQDTLQLMTLHSAKGLEFDTVVLAGAQEGLLPSSRSMHSTESLEEERRLFYVGITRARQRFVLSYATTRNSFGTISDQEASRFVYEMPQHLLSPIDARLCSPTQLRHNFSKWLSLKSTPNAVTFFTTSSKKVLTPAKKVTSTKVPSKRWAKNKTVMHETFGAGLITDIKKKHDGTYYVTALFKGGEKKILSTFLTLL